ncbi:MAG: hypothetical protein RMJ53_09930 [Chitinophagales bacterium]|nr:hypothetical protein [Chitinophagales bacterium]
MIKILYYCFTIVCFTTSLRTWAQDEDTLEPFFKFKKIKSAAYVQAGVSADYVFKNAGAFTHLSLHWLINQKWVASLHYAQLSSQNNISRYTYPNSNKKIFASHMFATFGFGYKLWNERKFSLQPNIGIGWAGLHFRNVENKNIFRHYLTIIPEISGTWNVSKNFRLGTGFHYRIVAGKTFKDINTGTLSGPGINIFMQLGKF